MRRTKCAMVNHFAAGAGCPWLASPSPLTRMSSPSTVRGMKTMFAVLLALAVSTRAAEFTKEPLETIKRSITAKKAVLVDTRGKEEWNDGHIEGAVFLPVNMLRRIDPAELEKLLPKDKVIYTHCVVGMRAKTAGKILEKHGYQVRVIKPGYEDLIEAGFPKAKE